MTNEYVRGGKEWLKEVQASDEDYDHRYLRAQSVDVEWIVTGILNGSGALARIEELELYAAELSTTDAFWAKRQELEKQAEKAEQHAIELIGIERETARLHVEEKARAERAEKRIEELEAESPNDEATSQLIKTVEALRDAADDEWKAHMLDGTAYILKTYADSHREMKMRLRDMEARVEKLEKALRQIVTKADKTHGDGYPHEASDADTYEDIARAALSQAQQSDE